jgi:pyruvate kinase
VRITRKAAVENFAEIMKQADGCIIARAYIAIETPVEDVIKQQYEMIQTCQRMLKPVLISTSVLESMLTQIAPSFTEMGDISNVVQQHVDGIALSSETTYGNHPVEVISALRRACRNVAVTIDLRLKPPNGKRSTAFNGSEHCFLPTTRRAAPQSQRCLHTPL